MLPMKGDLFPEIYPYDDMKAGGWAWKKYFRNPKNYIVIPKNANYKDMELMTAVFNGKMVDTSKQFYKEIPNKKVDQYYFV